MGEAGDALGHHPRVSIGKGYVDLELVSDDAIFHDDEGAEHVVEWVTQPSRQGSSRTPSDEIRGCRRRRGVPKPVWRLRRRTQETRADCDRVPRFHVEVYVAPEVAEQRIAAALAAGGTVVDDSDAPSLTVIADQDGNQGIVCLDGSAAKKD